MYSLLLDDDNGAHVLVVEEDLQFQINMLKRKLDTALNRANYNLLDPIVQKVSRDLDAILIRCLRPRTEA
ncbi:MAG: hypothetical protein FWG30_07245 [Eubacteriaceae bacterium]|nr:hypothetical protein [Eubacteriaceae bacterium]